MDADRVDHHEDDPDDGGEDDVDERANELFRVGANLLQFPKRLAAALVFKDGKRDRERMANAVGVESRADALNDDVEEVILEILGDA